MDDPNVSYILVRREGDKILYWKNGSLGGWTEDISDARLYARRVSGNAARKMILKGRGVDPEFLKVEQLP